MRLPVCALLWLLLFVCGFPYLPFVKCRFVKYDGSLSVFTYVSPILMAPACCLLDRVKRVVEECSLLILKHQSSAHAASLSTAIFIPYVAVVEYTSTHHITRSSVYRAALLPLGSSAGRSSKGMRNSVCETTHL